MKNKYIILFVLILFTGCKKDVLDKKNLNAINPDEVWNDSKLATAYVNKLCVDNLPTWDSGDIAAQSDEAPEGAPLMTGELTEESVDYWSVGQNNPIRVYDQIRNMNILLRDIDQGSLDQTTKDRLKGQTLVLRAWRYFGLVLRYGGVPLLTTPQELSDELMVPRAATSAVITQIVKDLDDAAQLLPAAWTGNDAGRISAAAALALKGRVLLFYASPQFNPNHLADRWNAAYEANKAAKQFLLSNGYGLFDDFAGLWFAEMNKEDIFVRRFNENASFHGWEAGTRPLSESQGYSGWNNPTLEMVRAFPMNNGLPISDPASGYDKDRYWLNRDPRFAATIVYNGALWELSGKKGRKQWTYTAEDDRNQSKTGFFCRKAVKESNTPGQAERGTTAWVEIRYAEVLLNLAECAAETGRADEAYTELKAIRQRAGIIPGVTGLYGLPVGLTGSALVNTVMEERRIELAFEAKRYWDLRRRRLFETLLNGKSRTRVLPTLKVSKEQFLAVRDQVNLNQDYTTYFTDVEMPLDIDKKINFRPDYYFFAIPSKYIQQNKNLQQTMGWSGGTFDPLK